MNGFTNASGKSSGEIEYLNITLLTNQLSHSDLIGTEFTVNIEGGLLTKTYTWEGNPMTIDIPAYVNYTITFGEVEGYRKPSTVTYTAQNGNRRTLNAKYETEVVKVSVVANNGASMEGAQFEINGKTFTWQGNTISHKVAYGSVYSVIPQSFSGFSVPSSITNITASQTEREITLTYIASALKVNILSNQGTDAAIANVKATVYNKKYSHEGWSYLKEVQNGDYINTSELGFDGVGFYKIEFSDIEGYKTPESITGQIQTGIFEVTGTYQCELLTVNVTADSGTPTGFEVTISKQETVGVATKYTRLEYIESTGTQYIDTGFKPNQDTRVVANMYLLQNNSSVSANELFGARTSTSSKAFAVQYNNSTGRLQYFYGSGYTQEDASFPSTNAACDANKNNLSYNGTEISRTYETFQCDYNLYLFALNNAGTVDFQSIARLYSCQVYDNGTLVRDYIPALRSDGIAGLYDVVNDTFYASNGSSNFTAGSKQEEVIATQTSVTGSYKIPFDASYTVRASNVSGYTTPSSVTRVASAKSYTISQQYTVITVRDLSLMDVYGNPINRSTANCYVVREAGQYKFPMVYGNAIKNGQVNTAAFTNNGGSYSHNFVNGSNNSISSPKVVNDSDFDAYVTLTNSDSSDLISNLRIENENDYDYICFDLSSVPSSGGNCIIKYVPIRENANTIWSWHIWLWPHDLTPVEITNSTGVKYNIMPVNLASKYDSDGVHIKNWFYQWGRKDPMLLPNAWNSTTDHTPGSITKSSKASSLNFGIANPSTFYYNSSYPYNWFGDQSYYNLWDAACTGTGNSDNDTVKTVYDPCPVGWKVPNGNTFTGLSIISNANGVVKMERYSGDTTGVGFPMSGSRHNSDGSLDNVGSYGYVWLSSANSQGYDYYLYFDSTIVNPQNYGRLARAFSIRPVQDDNIQLEVIMISFTIYVAGMDIIYQAESGMTWFEWANSEYSKTNSVVPFWKINFNGTIEGAEYIVNDAVSTGNIIGGKVYTTTYDG